MNAKITHAANIWLTAVTLSIVARLSTVMEPKSVEENDRGDVPGWVMITVMTAIVVIALLAVFKEQVTTAVTKAFQSVSGAG